MDQHHLVQGTLQSQQVATEKIRHGAPDGPRRQRSETYDGSSPLEYPGHEAVAQYLAAPKSLRELKSDTDVADYFQVTRMTIFRWKRDPDVIRRAHWLTRFNEMVGDIAARREWAEIVKKVIDNALNGDLQAVKFCELRAWSKDPAVERSLTGCTVSMTDLLGTSEGEETAEPQNDNRQMKGDLR